MDTNFKKTVDSLFAGMDNLISSKTVVGDAVHIEDTIILPLVEVSFGLGAGSTENGEGKNGSGGGGGLGAKIIPSAVIVIKDGNTKLVNIKNQDSFTKLLDLVPDLMDRFASKEKGKPDPEKQDVKRF
ncbi:GerW family sporulation protein [Anaerotalea alkaliphila]